MRRESPMMPYGEDLYGSGRSPEQRREERLNATLEKFGRYGKFKVEAKDRENIAEAIQILEGQLAQKKDDPSGSDILQEHIDALRRNFEEADRLVGEAERNSVKGRVGKVFKKLFS